MAGRLSPKLPSAQNRLIERIRDPKRVQVAAQPGTATSFAALEKAEYAVVVTFRRTGEAVPTPMYFGLHDGRAYVRSLVKAGKVKRLRNDLHVRVAPAGLRGVPNGPFAEATARILSIDAEVELAEQAIAAHYGLRRRLFEGLGRLVGGPTVYIELTATGKTAQRG